MILDRLVEKKDLLIYAGQRIITLRTSISKLNERLQDPAVSGAEKKKLMNGKRKIIGRIRELGTLRYVISNGILRKKVKEYWSTNHQNV